MKRACRLRRRRGTEKLWGGRVVISGTVVLAEEADARAVAALAFANTTAEEADARAVAALASANTTAEEANARAVAALAFAIICASSTVARTVLLRPQALHDV